jgi:hypothetical protein
MTILGIMTEINEILKDKICLKDENILSDR